MSGLWKKRFILIVDELVNNAVEHGSEEGDENTFVLMCTRQDNDVVVTIEITDPGRGNKNATEMGEFIRERQKTWETDRSRKRGRGFQILHKLVDALYFRDEEDGRFTVGIKKTLSITETADS